MDSAPKDIKDRTDVLGQVAAAFDVMRDDEGAPETVQKREARACALAYIAYGGRSSGRVRAQLLSHDYSPEIVEEVMAQLELDGYLQDRRLVEFAWERRQGRRAESIDRFAERMKKQEIEPSVIDKFVKTHNNQSNELRRLAIFLRETQREELLELRELAERGEKAPKRLQGLFRAALSRGFTAEQIRKVLGGMGIKH